MHDRWLRLREKLLDLAPYTEDEDLAAICNSNYWVVTYNAKGMRVFKGENFDQRNLTQAEAFSDPRVAKRYFWCPGCMKSIPCLTPTQINRHIATKWDSPNTFKEVLDTRPGYFEELYFRYPENYKQYKEKAEAWLKRQPKQVTGSLTQR